MPLESATHISQLVVTNPANSDGLNQADDHMRLIKSVLLTDVGDAMVSKKLAVVDGTSGAPSIGFAADAAAGIYRAGAGQMALVGSLIGQGTIDIGFLGIYAGSAVPTGYLACDGQAVSRTTYAALFAKIGTTWGVGDGSTTFNVPPLNNRYIRHRQDAGAAGAVGTLQADQNKAHTHTGSGTTGNNSVGHTHPFSGTTGAMSANATHTHGLGGANTQAGSAIGGVTGGGGFNSAINPGTITIASANTDHTHNISGTTGANSVDHTHPFTFTSAGGSADGTEARPLSASLLICIRAL